MDLTPWLGLGEAATLRSFSGLRVSPMPRWAMVCTNIKTDKRQVSTWVFIVLKCLLNGFNGISFVGCFSHRCFCGGSTKFDGWAAQASPYSTLSNSPWKGSKSPLHSLTRSSLPPSLAHSVRMPHKRYGFAGVQDKGPSSPFGVRGLGILTENRRCCHGCRGRCCCDSLPPRC